MGIAEAFASLEEVSAVVGTARLNSFVPLKALGFSMRNNKKHDIIIKNRNRTRGDGMGSIKPWEELIDTGRLYVQARHAAKTYLQDDD